MVTSPTPSPLTPVRPAERVETIDILRGLSVLGILLVNMLSFAGYATPFPQMNVVNQAAIWLIKFFAQAKFYPLFSFLFGWGMAIQMERAAQHGARFAPLYVRRLLALLLIGLIHAILIWDGDILITYALLGFPLLLFRKRSDTTVLIAALICILIPVLLSLPGPAADFRNAYARVTAGLLPGDASAVYSKGTYLAATLYRLKDLRYSYSQSLYWATHVFGMFLLGLYAGRRRLFQNVAGRLPLFRAVMWGGLIVGGALNLVFVAASGSPDLVPPGYADLAVRGARTVGGSALCLGYIAGLALLLRREEWRRRLSPLAAVGRAPLSNYLLQSIVCTLIFYGYGGGLYGKLGPAITLLLTLGLYRLQIALSGWWLARFRFGPAEWLWRSLTYGKRQPWRAARAAARTDAAAPPPDVHGRGGASSWLIFTLRRILFIALTAVAIAYCCILGVRLSANSTSVRQGIGLWDAVEPALDETVDFFADAFRGDLGAVTRGYQGRTRVPLKEALAGILASSASLLGLSIAIASVIGVAAGSIAASRRHSLLSLPTLTLTVIGVSIPSFFLALLLQIADIKFYQQTGRGLFPILGQVGYRKSLLPHIVPPALVLAARPLAHITRVAFVSLSEIAEREFIRTARAKGADPRTIFFRHILRNVGVSILTAVIVSLRFALGSLPVAEIFFNWPGVGTAMLAAIQGRDGRVLAVLAVSLGAAFLLINLLADLLYRLIDPRLRGEGSE